MRSDVCEFNGGARSRWSVGWVGAPPHPGPPLWGRGRRISRCAALQDFGGGAVEPALKYAFRYCFCALMLLMAVSIATNSLVIRVWSREMRDSREAMLVVM